LACDASRPMERLGAKKFTQYHRTEIPWTRCPECDHGLSTDKRTSELASPPWLVRALKEQTVPPDEEAGHFTASCVCTQCNTTIQTAGTWATDIDSDDGGRWFTVRVFKPAWMSHYPKLVQAGDSVPKDLRETLSRADALFWIDTSSCATVLRQAIEIFLDRQRIGRNSMVHGRRRFRTLEDRIREFVASTRTQSVARTYELLLRAAKTLANSGAHATKPLKTQAIQSVAGLVQRVLAVRYPAPDPMLTIAKKIDANHRRRQRQRQQGR
jgi:hypothetical protein